MDIYEIRTVQDFVSLPPEKRQHALTDFLMWMEIGDQARQYKLAMNTEVFKWADDGKHEVREINLKIVLAGDGKEQEVE